MLVESLISITFSRDEVVDALVYYLESKTTGMTPGTQEYYSRTNVLRHIKSTTKALEVEDGKFILMVDGVAEKREF
jgi:uncharacterized protein YtpQ (UPF0354 family)